MFAVARQKRRVGTELGDEPVLAEAELTFLDGWLAVGILVALVLNMAFGWWWADPVATLLVAGVAIRESRLAWTEAG
jgi:divalent metal cation (Fe/Co/Zn/Cd) transporter